MVRNVSFRSFATTALSGLLVLVLLSGCTNKPKNSTGAAANGSLKRISPARTVVPKSRPGVPLKPGSTARNAGKLAKAFKKDPANTRVAMSYIFHLRSLGMQQQSVNVLYRAYQANPTHPVIASEYGRLLLGSGKTTQAKRVLARIKTKRQTNWQTYSALGTIEARDGRYDKATHFFRKAHQQAPKEASVINNLALSIALGGHPDEAENLLRNADDSGRFGARLRQNLALVLALQGKYEEAQAMATTDLAPKQAAKNIAYLKRMLATTDSRNGVELTDETIPPSANLAGNMDDGPATTASIEPTPLTPEGYARQTRPAQE